MISPIVTEYKRYEYTKRHLCVIDATSSWPSAVVVADACNAIACFACFCIDLLAVARGISEKGIFDFESSKYCLIEDSFSPGREEFLSSSALRQHISSVSRQPFENQATFRKPRNKIDDGSIFCNTIGHSSCSFETRLH
jgi:hypothetical protein